MRDCGCYDPNDELDCYKKALNYIRKNLTFEPNNACEVLAYVQANFNCVTQEIVRPDKPIPFPDLNLPTPDPDSNDDLPDDDDYDEDQRKPIWWYHSDHLGSSTYLTDNFGRPSHYYETLPFGEMIVEHNQSTYNGGQYENAWKFNGKELDDATGMYYYGARYYDPRISIFVSVDPLAERTMTPYQYVNNNPILYVDPTGKEGIVYLVLLASADRKQVNQMVKKTNAFLSDIGVKTRVQIYEGNDMFHQGNLDPTDSFGVVGSSEEIVSLFENYKNNFKGISSTNPYDIRDSSIYELSDMNRSGIGTGFLIKTDLLEKGRKEFEAKSTSDFGAWLITHSMGHNSGSNHVSKGKAIMASGGLLAKTINPNRRIQSDHGGFITGRIDGVNIFEDVFNTEINLDMRNLLEGRFGTNSKDNYDKNSKRMGPRRSDGSF